MKATIGAQLPNSSHFRYSWQLVFAKAFGKSGLSMKATEFAGEQKEAKQEECRKGVQWSP